MELLNGKAKELFISFMCKKYRDFRWFEYENLLEVCQNALIIEWLDSVGYNIIITPYAAFINLGADLVGLDGTWSFFIYKSKELMSDGVDFEIRQEATAEAIKKAVELINESNG